MPQYCMFSKVGLANGRNVQYFFCSENFKVCVYTEIDKTKPTLIFTEVNTVVLDSCV